MIHIVPVNDQGKHNVKGLDCWCRPEFDATFPDDVVVHHHACDLRPEDGEYARPPEKRLQPPPEKRVDPPANSTKNWKTVWR